MGSLGLSPEMSDRDVRLTFLSVHQGKKVRHVVNMLKQGRHDKAIEFIRRQSTRGLCCL
jgi:hypothetical protein